jgi:hypothetical protein
MIPGELAEQTQTNLLISLLMTVFLDIALFSRELCASDMAALFNIQHTRSPPKPVPMKNVGCFVCGKKLQQP